MSRTFFTLGASLSLAITAAVALSFILPAGAALIPLFAHQGMPLTFDHLRALVSALMFTATQALLSSLVAILVGIPAAFLVARREFPLRRLLLSLSGIPLCVPPVIVAFAFVLFYGRQGYLNTVLQALTGAVDPPITFLYSLWGVVLAHGLYNFPVVLRAVSQIWERTDPCTEEAAALLGAGRLRILRTVVFPQLAGAVFSSGALVFLYCFFSFVIVLLFGGIGGTSLEVELFQAARSDLNFRYAALVALTETLAGLGIVLAYVRIEGQLSSRSSRAPQLRPRHRLHGTGELCLSIAYLLSIAVFFLGPLVSVVCRSLSIVPSGTISLSLLRAPWQTLFSRPSFFRSLGTTVWVSSCAAFLSTIAALALTLLVGRSRSAVTRVLPLAPLAVSSVMLGFGWIVLAPRMGVYTLVLAQASLSLPFAWTQIRASFDRIPVALDEGAALLSTSSLDRQFRVRLPLVARGIQSAFALSFAIACGDATLPLVLSLDRFENLSLLVYRLAGSYRFAEASAAAVFLALLSSLVFFLQDGQSKVEDAR